MKYLKYLIASMIFVSLYSCTKEDSENGSHDNIITAPTIQWQKTFGGTNWESANWIQQTSDGGYILAGETTSYDGDLLGNGNDCWIIKLNSLGVIEWNKTYGNSLSVGVNSVQQTSDGGYIFAGYVNSNEDFVWIMKLNTNGTIQWERQILGEGALCVRETSDTGFIIAAGSNESEATNHGNGDVFVIKLNTNGATQWQKYFGGSSYDIASSIEETNDGGFIVAGTTSSNDGDVIINKGFFDFWVIKLNNSGTVQWQKTYGGNDNDHASSICQTADGGYIAIGQTSSTNDDVNLNPGGYSIWVLKLYANGNIQWDKTYGGTSVDVASNVQQTNDGGYIISGITVSTDGDVVGSKGGADGWIFKLNPIGSLQWQKVVGGSSDDSVECIQQTLDHGFIISGNTYSTDGGIIGNHGGGDLWVVKLSEEIITN